MSNFRRFYYIGLRPDGSFETGTVMALEDEGVLYREDVDLSKMFDGFVKIGASRFAIVFDEDFNLCLERMNRMLGVRIDDAATNVDQIVKEQERINLKLASSTKVLDDATSDRERFLDFCKNSSEWSAESFAERQYC